MIKKYKCWKPVKKKIKKEHLKESRKGWGWGENTAAGRKETDHPPGDRHVDPRPERPLKIIFLHI